MRRIIAVVMVASVAMAGRVERVAVDLGRPQQQVVVQITEQLDNVVEAIIKKDGADYDIAGWLGVLWYGDDKGGMAVTNTVGQIGRMQWRIKPEQTPINGRYTMQISGVHKGKNIMQEWCRGVLSVRRNPSADSMPAEWSAGSALALIVAHTNDAAIHLTPEQVERIANAITSAPPQTVTSVNSKTGAVVITAADVGAVAAAAAPTLAVASAASVTGPQSNLIAQAWQNPASAIDWTWTSNGKEITLTGYSGPNAVVIPDMLDGLPVTGFGGIFTGNTDITSVSGGANIKAVGNSAFEACWTLNSVSLPACTTVGDAAFYNCGALNSVSLPACTTVGDAAFDVCWALNSVSLPACTTVGDYAFANCWALNSVSLPACTTVGTYAFAECGALISVSLPACTTVGNSAFGYCEALISVSFGQNAPAPAANVFEYSTPTIYVSNPHATGWGDTWNGRPVVRAASIPDIASHNASGTAHADIRALIPTLPGPGCTVLAYAADGTNVTITGATYSYFFAPDKAYTLSVAPDAPRYHYSIEIIGDHACTLPAGHRLRGSWTITGTNEVVVAPSTGTVWNVFGRGL